MSLNVTPSDPAADSYVDEEYFIDYAAAFGLDIDGIDAIGIESALRRGTRFIDATYGLRFIGVPTSASQALEWPRRGACFRQTAIPDDEIPVKVKNATCEAAYREARAPGALMPDIIQTERVIRKKIGEIETQYSDIERDPSASMPIVSGIDGILTGLVWPIKCGLVSGSVKRA